SRLDGLALGHVLTGHRCILHDRELHRTIYSPHGCRYKFTEPLSGEQEWVAKMGADVVIAGAGAAGLSLAYQLAGQNPAEAGTSVSLFHPVLEGEMGWSAGVVTRQGS
ncbi:hypothetical protein ACIPK2_41670, partial [Streptomyces hydrogenans]